MIVPVDVLNDDLRSCEFTEVRAVATAADWPGVESTTLRSPNPCGASLRCPALLPSLSCPEWSELLPCDSPLLPWAKTGKAMNRDAVHTASTILFFIFGGPSW